MRRRWKRRFRSSGGNGGGSGRRAGRTAAAGKSDSSQRAGESNCKDFVRFIIKYSFFCSKHSCSCPKRSCIRADYCYLTITVCKMQRKAPRFYGFLTGDLLPCSKLLQHGQRHPQSTGRSAGSGPHFPAHIAPVPRLVGDLGNGFCVFGVPQDEAVFHGMGAQQRKASVFSKPSVRSVCSGLFRSAARPQLCSE